MAVRIIMLVIFKIIIKMKKVILILAVAASVITSCKKPAGEGGNSSIQGKRRGSEAQRP